MTMKCSTWSDDIRWRWHWNFFFTSWHLIHKKKITCVLQNFVRHNFLGGTRSTPRHTKYINIRIIYDFLHMLWYWNFIKKSKLNATHYVRMENGDLVLMPFLWCRKWLMVKATSALDPHISYVYHLVRHLPTPNFFGGAKLVAF